MLLKAANVGKDAGVVDAKDKEGLLLPQRLGLETRKVCTNAGKTGPHSRKEVTEFAGAELEAGQGCTEEGTLRAHSARMFDG